jgi:hypothetical protein
LRLAEAPGAAGRGNRTGAGELLTLERRLPWYAAEEVPVDVASIELTYAVLMKHVPSDVAANDDGADDTLALAQLLANRLKGLASTGTHELRLARALALDVVDLLESSCAV